MHLIRGAGARAQTPCKLCRVPRRTAGRPYLDKGNFHCLIVTQSEAPIELSAMGAGLIDYSYTRFPMLQPTKTPSYI